MHAYFNTRLHKHEENLVRDYSDEIAETRSFVGHIESRTAEPCISVFGRRCRISRKAMANKAEYASRVNSP